MRVTPFGDAAWRLELPRDADPAALGEALRASPGVVDALVTDSHALVTFDPARPPDRDELRRRAAETAAAPRRAPAVHVVRVRYDGPDLDEVAAAARLPRDAVIARHAAARYRVRFLGFLPGFAYLGGLDAALQLPRRATPRPRVPAGAVAIAGPYAGIYPLPSPGGWHLFGTAVGFTAFSPARGAALAPGDEVRFEVAG